MSSTIEESLRRTAVSRWHGRLAGNQAPRRNHWRTKVVYYQAVEELLASRPNMPLTWKSVVAAARPHGSRSTFYEVAGGHARHRMVDELITDGGGDTIQIALRYARTDPVEQLIDEAKVWSFWPYRQRLLAAGAGAPETTEALIAAVATWARTHEALAAAVGHTPPACAVEDLTVLNEGRLAGLRAAARLTDVIRTAVAA
jgi:hypothetical protein